MSTEQVERAKDLYFGDDRRIERLYELSLPLSSEDRSAVRFYLTELLRALQQRDERISELRVDLEHKVQLLSHVRQLYEAQTLRRVEAEAALTESQEREKALREAVREIDRLDGRYADLNTARYLARNALQVSSPKASGDTA